MVDEQWRGFFDAHEHGDAPAAAPAAAAPSPPGQGSNGHTNGYANGNGNGNGAAAHANGNGAAPSNGKNGSVRPSIVAMAAAASSFGTGADRDEHLLAAAALQGRVYQLVNAYRVRGHLFAKIDPLGTPTEAPGV